MHGTCALVDPCVVGAASNPLGASQSLALTGNDRRGPVTTLTRRDAFFPWHDGGSAPCAHQVGSCGPGIRGPFCGACYAADMFSSLNPLPMACNWVTFAPSSGYLNRDCLNRQAEESMFSGGVMSRIPLQPRTGGQVFSISRRVHFAFSRNRLKKNGLGALDTVRNRVGDTRPPPETTSRRTPYLVVSCAITKPQFRGQNLLPLRGSGARMPELLEQGFQESVGPSKLLKNNLFGPVCRGKPTRNRLCGKHLCSTSPKTP